jgi:radical SAM superfamily enzyme YgiQ (UPF0313 family)
MPRDASRASASFAVMFPVGLAYISSSLKNSGHNVYTVNLELEEGDIYTILHRLIYNNSIDVVCTGGLSLDYYKILTVLNIVKEIDPKIITVVGGGIMSSDPTTAMNALNIDIGVIGQGELTICELADALDTDIPYYDIAGLIVRDKDGLLRISSPRKEINDLNTIPFPDFHGFSYGEWVRCNGTGIIACSRSCTHTCTFCFHPSGQKYRQRSLDSIFDEIDYQVHNFDINNIALIDELFATKRDRLLEFCSRIKQYNLSWSCGLRVCDVDTDLLFEMKKAGCQTIGYGLESADDSVLKSMRKGITVKQIDSALDATYKASINVLGNFIFGDLNENKYTAANTLQFWRKHIDRNYVNLDFIVAYPGTYIYKYACENGLIVDKEQFLKDGCPLVNLSKLSSSEYKELRSLVTELRLHPHVLCKSLRVLDIHPDGKCNVEFECRKCGAINSAELFYWYKATHICSNCGLINEVDPFEIALHSYESLFSNLPDSGNIALWGAGGIYYKFSQKYNSLSSERFILIDVDKQIQELNICGKKVLPPDEIVKGDIKTVVIMAISRKDEIYDLISRDYPSVDSIFVPAFDIQMEGVVPIFKHFQRIPVQEN